MTCRYFKLKCLDSCLYDFTDSVECKITSKTILKNTEKQCPGGSKIEENRCFRVIFGALGSLGGPLGGS